VTPGMLSANGVSRGRRPGGTVGSVLSRRGDVLVSQSQRARMLSSAVKVIAEYGYAEMSVARITADAGVSRRTFYDVFEDREDCFLCAFEDAASRARETMLTAYRQGSGWRDQIRAALFAGLELLEQEPGTAMLLVVDALKSGPRVQRRRAELLRELSHALHESGSAARTDRGLPGLTGEGIVGAVLGVIHTRLHQSARTPLVGLGSELMGVIALPYLGAAAAGRELQRPTPARRVAQRHGSGRAGDVLVGLPMRITQRTLLVLTAIGERPAASNRQVADEAGISDQGQISKLLTRLGSLGLIENTSPAQPSGEPNRWRLTARGEQVVGALRTPAAASASSTRRTKPEMSA
jgi:AcrR family transcriptional regulator